MFSSLRQIPTGKQLPPLRVLTRNVEKFFEHRPTDACESEFERRCPSKVEKRRLIPEPKSVRTRWAIFFFFLSRFSRCGRWSTGKARFFFLVYHGHGTAFIFVADRAQRNFSISFTNTLRRGSTGKRDRANPVRGIVKNELLGPRYYSVIPEGGPPPGPG